MSFGIKECLPNLKQYAFRHQTDISEGQSGRICQGSYFRIMIECVYRNESSRMVIVKCIGEKNFYREKVVLPTEIFWFEAPVNARLEIWKMSISGQMLHLRADVSEYAIENKSATESLRAS